MVKFSLSAFSDELSPEIDRQIEWLSANGIGYMEVRGVDGTPVAQISEEEAVLLHGKLEKAGISVSAVGSPIGKIGIKDDFGEHIALFRHVCAIAHILGAQRIRVFSFFMPEGEDPEKYRCEVISRMRTLCDIAKEEGVVLCHENEKNIYGDTPERCLELYEAMGGDMKCVFDHANFISCGVEPFPYAYNMLKSTLSHMHIKDADSAKEMVPAGEGVGRIPETIAALAGDVQDGFILTLEPHLMTFDGLQGLESEGHTSKLGNRYASPEDAFDRALEAVRNIIGKI